MIFYTLIKGEELYKSEDYHEKAFSIGSMIQWGDKVWEIVKATDGCKGCYFYGGGKCYCTEDWFDNLGCCTQIVRPDEENVVFHLSKKKV